MASRNQAGERFGTNIFPFNKPSEWTNLEVDKAVTAHPLNGDEGCPRTGPAACRSSATCSRSEPRTRSTSETARATILFFDITDPEDRRSPPVQPARPATQDNDHNKEFGADPVGLTAVRADDGACCRYLMVVAGGPANKDVALLPVTSRPRKDHDDAQLDVSRVGSRRSVHREHARGVPGSQRLAEGSGPFNTGQHQMLDFVREGNLDGQLYLIGGRRTGAIAEPVLGREARPVPGAPRLAEQPGGVPADARRVEGDERGVVGQLHVHGQLLRRLEHVRVAERRAPRPRLESRRERRPHLRRRVPDRQLRAREQPDAATDRRRRRPVRRRRRIERHADGAGARADHEGVRPALLRSERRINGSGAPPWLPIEFETRDVDTFDSLDRLGDRAVDINEQASSWRWFAPPGCTISANDYPITSLSSDEYPGPDTVQLRGTGRFEEALDLEHLPVYRPAGALYPVSPVPAGVTPTIKNYNDDVGGMTFYEVYRDADGNLVRDHRGCESYYAKHYTLGWDLDGNDSFESDGDTVPSAPRRSTARDNDREGAREAPGRHVDRGSRADTAGAGQVRNVPPKIASPSSRTASATTSTAAPRRRSSGFPSRSPRRSRIPASPTRRRRRSTGATARRSTRRSRRSRMPRGGAKARSRTAACSRRPARA